MKHVKTAFRNKMSDELLVDSMIIYIERELFKPIDSDSIVDDFYFIKNRQTQFQ